MYSLLHNGAAPALEKDAYYATFSLAVARSSSFSVHL